MKQKANAIDTEKIEEREGVKSISSYITFDEDTNAQKRLQNVWICFHRVYIQV